MLLTPFYLIAVTLVGLGDTLYLSYFQYINKVPSCAIGGCSDVLTSVYSKFFGVPWSYIGLVYYVYMLSLLVLLVIEPRSRALRFGVLVYGAIGLLYSIYAIFYIQLATIHQLCEYCLISALCTLVLFCLALWHWRISRT